MLSVAKAVSIHLVTLSLCCTYVTALAQQPAADTANLAGYGITKLKVGPGDWPQWGGTSLRNNAPHGKNIPTDWIVPDLSEPYPPKGFQSKNVKWSAPLGSQSYGSPVVAGGKVYVGTNNGFAHLKRVPRDVDASCLICFDEQTGRFLWQHTSLKLPAGRVQDWPMMGHHSVPLLDGDRLWFVTNRSEIVCLDAAGFDDGENDGPFKDEEFVGAGEADVVWKFDLMKQLGVVPHERSVCSLTCVGDILLCITSNGPDGGEINIPAPTAPSFVAIHRTTAEVIWTDNTPGPHLMNGQWSSPTFAVLGGKPQVLMAGGDGWLYSFDPRGDGQGKSKLWWKFDGNRKQAKFILGGRGNFNEIVAPPVVYDNKIYIAMGQDPEHGEGSGRLWCLDPTKSFDGGDVSVEHVVTADGLPAPFRRGKLAPGEQVVPNPNSAEIWHYDGFDLNGDGKLAWEEEMHRTCSPVVVKDDLLYLPDLSGLMNCLDAQTGRLHWTHDLLAAINGWNIGALIVDGKVFVGGEEGKIFVFALDKKKRLLNEVEHSDAMYTTPIVANDVLFIATKTALHAICTFEQPVEKKRGR